MGENELFTENLDLQNLCHETTTTTTKTTTTKNSYCNTRYLTKDQVKKYI